MAQRPRYRVALTAIVCLVCTGLVQAAPLYWAGGSPGGVNPAAGHGTWSTSSSDTYWTTAQTDGTNAPWTDGSDAVFLASGTSTVTVVGSVAPNAIAFTGAGYTVTGGTVTVGAGGITVDSPASFNVAKLDVAAGAAAVWTINGTNTLTIAGGTMNIPIGASLAIKGSGDVYTTTSLGMPNQHLLTMQGTGTLTLAGTGDNGGLGLHVKSGTVVLAKQSTSGAHAVGGPGIGSLAAGALVQLAGTGGDQIYTSATVNLTGGTLDFNGRNEGFNALKGTGAVLNNAANTTSTMSLGDSGGGDSFSGSIADGASGTGILAVTKTGTGTQTLSGTNTYSGLTTVAAGTLKLGSANALGATTGGTTVASGAVLDLNGQNVGAETLTLAGTGSGGGALSNSSGTTASLAGDLTSGTYAVGGTGNITLTGNVQGTLTKVGTNTLTLGGTVDNNGLAVIANSGTVVLAKNPSSTSPAVHAIGGGGLTVAGATVQLGGPGGDQIYSEAAVTVNSGTLDFNGYSEGFNVLGGSGGTIRNNAAGTTSTLTVGETNGSGAYAGAIAAGNGTLALTKTGTGTLALSGNNTYRGATTVKAGTLVLGSATALGDTASGTTVESGAVLDLNGQNVGREALTIAGTGLSGGGALVNNSATAASLAGDIVNANATYSVGGTGDITLTGNVRGMLTKVGANTLIFGGTADNAGLGVTANSGTVLLAKSSSPAIHAIGGSVLTVAGATVRLDGPGGDQIYFGGNVTVNSGTFDFNGYNEGFNALNGSGGTIRNNAAGTTSTMTVGERDSDGVYAGTIADGAGMMALTKTGLGTLTLSGNNTYPGATTIANGILKLAATGSIDQSATIDVRSGATLDLAPKTAGFTLAAGQTLTGAGTVQMPTATVALQGLLAPGNSIGTLTLTGAGTLDISSDAAELAFELGASSDRVLLTEGVLDLGTSVLDLTDFTFTTNDGFGSGMYTLFETSRPILGSLGPNLSGLIAGTPVTLSLSPDGTDLQLNAVCEPSSLLLVASAALALGGLRRRSTPPCHAG